MKKVIVSFIAVLMLSALASAVVVPIDATLKGVDANGVQTFSNSSIVTVLVVLENSTSYQAHSGNAFSYWGVDPNTGMGVMVGRFDSPARLGLDTTLFATPPSGQRLGLKLYATGSVLQYNGYTELVLTPPDSTAIQLVGTGFAVPTTNLPSLSAMTGFDQTLATGGEFYEGKLIKVTNVHVAQASWTISSTAGTNILITDSLGQCTVTLRFDTPMGAQINGTLGATPTLMSGNFNLVAIASQYDSSSPYTSGYQLSYRGIETDIQAYTAINRWEIYGE